MKLSVRALWVIAALTGAASAQHTGDIPPALVWDKLKGNCPASVDWASLRGKVVVVSLSPDDVFPNDIDDWKEAARRFQGEQVSFIQVVGGSEFLMDQAVQQTAYRGCVLFDTDRRNLKNFKLPLFERTVVVDQWGFIAGYARSGDDMKSAVRSVLNNQPDTGRQCPHCDKTFAVLSGLASHLHYLHPDKLALERPGKQPRPHGESGQVALPVVSSNTGSQEQGKTKKLTCAYCDKAFARPSSLATHIRYLHPGKSQAATALPLTTFTKASAPVPVPVVAPNASAQEHLKTALQELTQRQRDVDEQLSRIETLQSEKGAITKQIDAVNAALQAFEQ
jgi:hypothetical protein